MSLLIKVLLLQLETVKFGYHHSAQIQHSEQNNNYKTLM